MADMNPFLGDGFVSGSYGSESAYSGRGNYGAIQEVEELVEFRPDLGLKTVHDEDIHRDRDASYRAAVQYNLSAFRSTRTSAATSSSSELPVYDPDDSRKGVGVAYSSSTGSRLVGFPTLSQSGVYRQPTSDGKIVEVVEGGEGEELEEELGEEEGEEGGGGGGGGGGHPREEEFHDAINTSRHGVSGDSDASAAFEASTNGMFQLCFIAPKSISACTAVVENYEVNGSSGDQARTVQFHLEPTLDSYNFPYNFWFSEYLPQREERKCQVTYHITVIDTHVSSGFVNTVNNFKDRVVDRFTVGGKPAESHSERVVVSVLREFQRRRLSFRFDVVNDRGEFYRKDANVGITQWLAMLTQMIFVANCGNIGECVREYWRVRTDLKLRELRVFGSYFEPKLGAVVKWASEVADAHGGTRMPDGVHRKVIGVKMFMLSLGLFELLKELVRVEDCSSEKLAEVYELILCSLRKFTFAGCGYNPPALCERIFQEGVSELVGRTARFSFEWMSGLETLGRYDPAGNFLQRVGEVQVNMRDMVKRRDAEQAYGDAVRGMANSNEVFGKGKGVRRLAFQKALFAAPTLPMFLIAGVELRGWMSGATDWDKTENVDEETRAELEDGLHGWFRKVMPDVTNPWSRPAMFLQQHLEVIVAGVRWEAVAENVVLLPDFLVGSFRLHVAEMVLEIMAKLPYGNGKKSDWNTVDLVSLVNTMQGLVLNYPFTFTLPLRPAERLVLLKLASTETDDLHNLSKLIVQKVGGHYSTENLSPENMEHLTKDVLRPWLLESTKRAKQTHSPLSYFRCVQDILNLGVHPSSALALCLTQAAVASSQQQSRGLQNFLAEVERISQLHESLQVQFKGAVVNMMHLQLQTAPNAAELDRLSEQILRSLCTQHGHGTLTAKEKAKRNLKRMSSQTERQRTKSSIGNEIQVELCVALLNEMAENAVFVENLTERAFQTISASNFATCLLQIQSPPAGIKDHWIYVKVQEGCYSFGTLVERGEVTLGTIESVSHTPDKWRLILKSLGNKPASVALENAIRELTLYRKRLQACEELVTLSVYLSGKGFPIQGIADWSTLLKARKENWRSTLLRMLMDSHWPEEAHPSLFRYLESLLLLHKSEIFRCMLLDSCRGLFQRLTAEGKLLPPLLNIDEGSPSSSTPDATFAMVAGELVPRAVQTYRAEMEPYCGKKNLEKMNMSKLYSLWVTVDAQQIEEEFDLARRELNLKPDSKSSVFGNLWPFGKGVDIVEILQAWKAIKAKGKLVDALPTVAELFQFDKSCEGYLEQVKHLMNECNENCTLKEFSDVHKKEGKTLLGKISVNEEIAFIQLAKSEPLITFLKDKLDEDFRNLIDAVEEGSDNDFVQQSILSDFIDLHRMFRPVLKFRSSTFENLRTVMFNELRAFGASETASASTLAAKLNVCNENVAQITRFLSSVANRGLKMKDHMKRILRGGRYHFTVVDTVCSLRLTCGDTGIRYAPSIFETEIVAREETCVYNLGELQDLRSRARLVLSTHKAQAKRFGSDQADTSDAETEKDTVHFIEQVDIVEQLVTLISELYASGHFRYAQFDHSLSGLQELQALGQKIEKELREWYAAVKEARSANYCLNYFRSMELRLILEVLNDGCKQPEVEMCLELLQWAGVKNPRPALDKAREDFAARALCRRSHLPSSLSDNLMWIAKSLEPLFQTPPTAVPLPGLIGSASFSELTKSRSMNGSSPRKHNEALVLALVEESQMEHEAVVSLFHKRGLSLRDFPRNVLLCSSATTWEEISLLLLRCFKRGVDQEEGLSCIAYIEKLSLECQAQFLVVLQEMVHDWEESHHREPHRVSKYGNSDCERLALVCCSKSQALLAVSHHLNVRVCHMGTLNSDEVCEQLPAECSNMRVITSEIPGLGKTTKVHSTAPGLVRTLCVSGNTSRSSLISQLKKLDLHELSILHLDISSVVNAETFNVLLFELLVLGCLKSDVAGVFHLNTSHIHVELGNTLGNELAHSLPVCDWFQREHLTWDLDSLEVDDDPGSDMQVVCIYLHELELRQIESKNLVFSGAARNVEALPAAQCQGLLRRHFIDYVKEGNTMSFSIVEMFVKFFACQLRSLTESIYFRVEMLQFMQAMANIRTYLVMSLLEVSRDLSLRSVKPWLHEQQQSRGKVTDLTMESRFKGMLRWSDSNHLMIFFQTEGPVSFLYRNVNLLPESITQLISSQRLRTDPKKMPDYTTMSSKELWSNLWPILQRSAPSFEPSYVLTADNFLKMALIALRVAAQVPVLIMGETGCGKTSLLRILARYCGVVFSSITLHAGTTAEDIRSFIIKANLEAMTGTQKVWAFLDEINACDHLGFLNGMICHHLLDGKPLDVNLVLLAACNPYRVHDIENSQTGFSSRELMNPGDVQRYNLAYRVHPLPEAMLDYVWDFGLLSRHDEQAYIEAMVRDRIKVKVALFADLLVQSQAFARECHGEASVSLRDASRCISLYKFFERDLENRPLHTGHFRNVQVRATLLAFSHCYHSRLATEVQRRNYRYIFADVLRAHETYRVRDFTETTFAELLRAEQLDLLNRMDVPVGIARNKAILENVFVTLVCMLNHIPVFVIGKPGSGKTLALQLIYGNLRGTESRDSYFQKLPQMYRFSYQGSESSTSEGILKVFEKAQRCKQDNAGRDVLVVVVLDEVGLAEVSSHNPLKVLHALLEPEEPQQVAVVGISNWSLDAAKMNRAIHLSQPDPSEQDLYDTSIAILESYDTSKSEKLHETLLQELRGLAKSYHTYHSFQTKPNFHGLRDFYSLIKSLQVKKSTVSWQLDGLVTAVWRNFGGSPNDVQRLSQILKENLGHEELLHQPPSVMDLVRENLQDKDARHLMLITTGDSAIGILEKFQKNVIIIHGSKFKDDCSDDYSYLLLSIIILHMEAGRCILLRGVERLWSSLYDMLNQHYTTVAERRNCRIAIGAYSNPMCYVHDSFRCIVVVDSSQVSRLDPPFLNRFEKQVLAYENILTNNQKQAVQILKAWCEQLAGLSTDSKHSSNAFKIDDLFAGFHEDTLPSLVLHHQTGGFEEISSTNSSEFALLLDRCKEDLLRTAHLDAMVRASLSAKCREKVPDLDKWTGLFFGVWQDQQGLKEFLETAIQGESVRESGRGLRVVITTRTIIHMPIKKFLGETDAQIEKLGDFSSERQLQTQILQFLTGHSSLLIIQADSVMDKEHIQHAKFLVDKNCAEFQAHVSRFSQVKHIVLLVHTHRETESLSGFTFLSGWQQITLDQLQKEDTHLRVFLDNSVAELVNGETIPLKEIMVKVLTWSFLCIKYPKSVNSAAYCQEMVQRICEDTELWGCLKSRALEWLNEYADPLWQASVASDRRLLSLSSSLQDAFLQHIEEELRDPIARLVYLLEKTSDLGSYFTMDAKKMAVWRATVLNSELVDIESVSVPRHPEGYQVECPLNLSLPFVSLYAQRVDSGFQDLYLTQLSKSSSSDENPSPFTRSPWELMMDRFYPNKGATETEKKLGTVDPGDCAEPVVPTSMKIGHDILATMRDQLPEFAFCIDTNPELYVRDFSMLYAPYKCESRSGVESQAFEWVVRGNLGAGDIAPPNLHVLMWEHGEKLKAQALLVASCLTEASVADQLTQLKRKRLTSSEFDEYLVGQCYAAILPQSEMVKESFLQSVEMHQWVDNLELLINLASPLEAFGGPTRWATVTSLEVLRDLARMVPPGEERAFSLDRMMTLQGLIRWLGCHGMSFTPGQLLEAVLDLVPDLHTLIDSVELGSWSRFLASFFRKVLKGKTTMFDVNTIAAFLFKLRDVTSVMKNLLVCVLDASLSHSLAYFVDARCPKYMQFLLNGKYKGALQVGEVSLDGDGHAAFVLLSDIIYESLTPSFSEALFRGDALGTEWSSKAFDLCLNTALELMDLDGPLTVQVTAAFAFLRAILDAVASELVFISTSTMRSATFQCHSSPLVSALAERIRQNPSSTKLRALKLYLLKVLHMKRGLSLVGVSNLATKCGQITELNDYTTVLQWETMHDVLNPLGFDPFWSSSAEFDKAGEAIYYVGSGNESRGGKFIERPTVQKQVTAAIGSKLYLTWAARALTPGESTASHWFLRPKSLQKWDSKWRELARLFSLNDRAASQWSNLKLSPNMPTQELWFRTLAAHIVFVVTGLPKASPLQGYITLDREHLEAGYVVAAPNSSLAAFRTIIGNGKELGEYQCPCGLKYFVGECKRPTESINCTNCDRRIGGVSHNPIEGTVKLEPQQIENGYIIDNVSRSDTFYSVRGLDHKCYRLLRLILHFCLSIGVCRGTSTEPLRKLLRLQQQSRHPLEELQELIEEDFAKLDLLLACNREITVKYVHSVVSFLSGMQHNVALSTPAARSQWEAEFQKIFTNDSFVSGAHKAAADYLKRQKGNDRYSELVEERGSRLFAPALENILRITVAPTLSNFRAMYKQDTKMINENLLIQVFFNHEKHLEDLKHFMNLITFCNTAHEKFSFKISRPEAASMSMRDALQESSGLNRQFQQFADSWNAIRKKVKGYECKELTIPIMDKDARLAMCLVEPRDHGLHIVALFEYLRTIQNAFLRDAADALDASSRDNSPRTMRVQACKTEDIVHYHRQWLENVVKEVAMADTRSGTGQQVLYDNVIIQERLLQGLVKGKPRLANADWLEFPYKHESFHRHATILADVGTAITQEALRPDTLQAVQREIESGGVGAGQFLEMMNLCLGFLRRTGGHQHQALGDYCGLWLGKDSAEVISKSRVFDKICLKHIVSLYEGLEDSASNNVEMLVCQKYRTPLTSSLVDEILDSVKTENTWKGGAHVERIPASAFLSVLRRFMFRYLSVDNLNKDVQLSIYLTNSTIAKWPADVVSEDVVENSFPLTLTLQHSFATYMLLAVICKGGDWLKAGVSNGWITRPER